MSTHGGGGRERQGAPLDTHLPAPYPALDAAALRTRLTAAQATERAAEDALAQARTALQRATPEARAAAYDRVGEAYARAQSAQYDTARMAYHLARAERGANPNPYQPNMRTLAATTSTVEVEHWLAENVPGPRVALGGAPVESARELAAEVARLAVEQPTVMREMAFIGAVDDARSASYVRLHHDVEPGTFTSRDRTTTASTRQLGERQVMLLSPRLLASPRAVVERVIPSVDRAHWAAAMARPVAYTVRHEFGHAVQHTLMAHRYDEPPSFERLAYERIQGARGEPARLSRYADVDSHNPMRLIDGREYFAEAFAAQQYAQGAPRQDSYVTTMAARLRDLETP